MIFTGRNTTSNAIYDTWKCESCNKEIIIPKDKKPTHICNKKV